MKFTINAFVCDILTLMVGQTPVFDSRLHDPTDGPETYLAAVPFLRRAPYVISFGLWIATGLGAAHHFLSLVCVGLGYSNPALWPDMLGGWQEAYTIRKLWG